MGQCAAGGAEEARRMRECRGEKGKGGKEGKDRGIYREKEKYLESQKVQQWRGEYLYGIGQLGDGAHKSAVLVKFSIFYILAKFRHF